MHKDAYWQVEPGLRYPQVYLNCRKKYSLERDLQPCLFLQFIELNDEFIEVIMKNILIVLLERMCW